MCTYIMHEIYSCTVTCELLCTCTVDLIYSMKVEYSVTLYVYVCDIILCHEMYCELVVVLEQTVSPSSVS